MSAIQAKKILVYATQLMYTGGIESHIVEFCAKMKTKNVDIDLFVPNCHINDDNLKVLKASCKHVFLFKSNRNKFSWVHIFFQLIRLNANKYDALYTNGQGGSIELANKLLWNKKRWVHHHHTSGDEKDQRTWGKLYTTALKKADTLIACSRYNASLMSAFLNRKVDTVPCFSRQFISTDKPINAVIELGYYGRLIKEKGIDLICKLSNESDFKHVKFNIWGEGSQYPASFFEAYPTVFYGGSFTNAADLQVILNSIDGFILLSTHPEGLPISLLEVMGVGLPWAATKKGGIPDIANNQYATQLIDLDCDFEAVKAQMLHFVQIIQQHKYSKQEQINYYEDNFSAAVVSDKWITVLFHG